VGISRARRQRQHKIQGPFVFPLDLLSETLREGNSGEEDCFEEVIEPILDDLLSARREYEESLAEIDEMVKFSLLTKCTQQN
jgi:hypothetical protein